MPWYDGKSLLDHLESIEVNEDKKSAQARMPVQWVIRPQTDELHDYRGYAGRILSGSFNKNDKITVLPSGIKSEISKIETNMQEQDVASVGSSVTIHLKDNIDIGRGDILVNSSQEPILSQSIEADLCWMDTRPLDSSIMYLIQHNSKVTKCKIREILHKVNINTLEKIQTDTFQLNDIGRIVLKTAEELAFDFYQDNKLNGGAILIDPRTNLTVGALMFRANVGY
jgi:sulfate adenylyltransferase subunit 1